MNKDFYLFEDKAIVTDENGEIRELDNSDNIGDVLQQENIVEALRNEIISLNSEKNNQKNPIYYGTGHIALISLFIGSMIILLALLIVSRPVSFTELLYLLGAVGSITIGGSLPFTISDLIKHTKYQKNQEYLEYIISKLREKYDKESKKLVDLKSEMKKVNAENPSVVCQVNNEEVERINNETTNSIEFSRNVIKYLKYYRKGLLARKLGREKANAYEKQIEDNVLFLIRKI